MCRYLFQHIAVSGMSWNCGVANFITSVTAVTCYTYLLYRLPSGHLLWSAFLWDKLSCPVHQYVFCHDWARYIGRLCFWILLKNTGCCKSDSHAGEKHQIFLLHVSIWLSSQTQVCVGHTSDIAQSGVMRYFCLYIPFLWRSEEIFFSN